MYKSAKSAAQNPLTKADTVEFKDKVILIIFSSAAKLAKDNLGNKRQNPVIVYGTTNTNTAYWNDSSPIISPPDSTGKMVPTKRIKMKIKLNKIKSN